MLAMKIAVGVLGLLVTLAMAGAARQPDPAALPPGLPPSAGVYLLADSAKWIKLTPAPVETSQIKNKDVFLETAGQLALNMTFTYSGGQALFRTADPRPTFCVRGVGSAADALIVRLSRQKDRRTVRATSTDAGVGNKAGFRRQEIRPVAAVPISEGLFSVKPEAALDRGEYILVFGSALTAYDFGIGPARK